jgi:uncharacterized protein YndB with AHSA1/START domain
MNLETTYDLDAPAEYIFQRITDHADFEALLMGYGANIERLDDETSLNVGMKWAIDGVFRGKQRQVEVALTSLTDNELVSYQSESKDVNAVVDMKLDALSAQKTRFSVDLKPKANTISARLILQSAKLARKTLEKRINRRFADFCQRLEDDYRDISRR